MYHENAMNFIGIFSDKFIVRLCDLSW